MDIDISETLSHKFVRFDQREDLGMAGHADLGERTEVGEDGHPVNDLSTGQFSDNERVTDHLAFVEQGHEAVISVAKMVDPDR